ncbi:GntR family transcriptional regulator [Hasllibacter sp. MH4015]|uniref:GntR family transcriptional regulator n=1 Tax=Hasllibacter sp. MH4015 TaxID=2854029 RepID=UPI001CD2871A|nr:GntR family transcriptional regulator [Hasllibacter sp. MH4015]
MARTPLYKAAETQMIARIKEGDWEVGRRLPNEFQLADEFGVSQGTMRRALISLEDMGYLNRKPGRGTLVATNMPTKPSAPAPVPRLLTEDGTPLVLDPFRARTDTRGATPGEADLFGSNRLATMERTLKCNGTRAAVDEVVVPEALIPALDEDAPADLASLLQAHGQEAARITATARAEMTDMALSVALSTDRHTPLLCVTSVALDGSGAAIARQVLRIAMRGVTLAHE